MKFAKAIEETIETVKTVSKTSTSKKKGGNILKQSDKLKNVKKKPKSFLNGEDYA